MTKSGLPRQREKITITCPICKRRNLNTNKLGEIARHNPHHADWLWTPWCGGGGETLEGAEVIQEKIELLVREGYMLRQVESGYEITKPMEPGDMVGMSQERLDEEQLKHGNMAAGVEHSVDILRGEPLFGEDEPEHVDEMRTSANILEDMGFPKRRTSS